MFSILISAILAAGIIGAYYTHLYLWKKNVNNRYLAEKNKHLHDQIEAAHLSKIVLIYTLTVALIYSVAAGVTGPLSIISNLKLGYNFTVIACMFKTLFLNSLLFLGPLIQFYQHDKLLEVRMKLIPNDAVQIKKIFMTSILEEMIFRVVIFGILKSAGYSDFEVNLITSLLFSVSNLSLIWNKSFTIILGHAHNVVHVYKELGPLKAIAAVLFQMAFTFIFAFYCGKIMIKYDSYYCAAMLHIYCNTMGFPPIEQLFPLDFKDHQKNLALGGYVIGILAFFYFI